MFCTKRYPIFLIVFRSLHGQYSQINSTLKYTDKVYLFHMKWYNCPIKSVLCAGGFQTHSLQLFYELQ